MPSAEPHTFSVGELADAIKSLLAAKLSRVYVEGEISGWRLYPSGHAYFTLKDQSAAVSCVMFASAVRRCKAAAGLKDGARVVVIANADVYAPRGQLQLVVLAAKLAGVGDLMQRYLELKARLEQEGLFDPARKRPLPFLPRRIGLVTSESGAVVHDMCTVLLRRFPALVVTLFPAQVQGETAPATIVAGLRYFNANPPDLVIVARGGGSFEDLFCFNDETLVRAVAASVAPVISAVGHETDFTLCDFAADRRAGTPSIAAEIAVPVMSEIVGRLDDAAVRLVTALRARAEFFAQRLDHLADALAAGLNLAANRAVTRLERASARLSPAMRLGYSRSEAWLTKASEKLALLSPYGVLDRGYAIVTDGSGAVVRSAAAVVIGEELEVRFADGTAKVAATGGGTGN